MDLNVAASVLYARWCQAHKGKDASGAPLPCWEALDGNARATWTAIAESAYHHVRKCLDEAQERAKPAPIAPTLWEVIWSEEEDGRIRPRSFGAVASSAVRWVDGKPAQVDTPYSGWIDLAGQVGRKFVCAPDEAKAAAQFPQAAAAPWGVWERPDHGAVSPRGLTLTSCGLKPAPHAHPVAAGPMQGEHVLVPVAQLRDLAKNLGELYRELQDKSAGVAQ